MGIGGNSTYIELYYHYRFNLRLYLILIHIAEKKVMLSLASHSQIHGLTSGGCFSAVKLMIVR